MRCSQALQDVASSLARRLAAGIDLLYIEDIKTCPHDRFDAAGVRAWHARNQARLNEAAGGWPVPVRALMRSGSPAEQILRALRTKASPELVIMCTGGRRGMERLLVGSVAEEVIRHSKRPVMVIGPAARERAREFGVPRRLDILVPTDLGRNSRPAERYALSLAKRTGSRVFLYHCLGDSYRTVIRDSSSVSGWVPYNLDDILARIREDSTRSLEQKVRFFQDRSVSCDYKIEEKDLTASCAVYQEGSRGYSLVVMGTHGRSLLLEAFFGSTARETVLNATVPVIVVQSGK